MYIYGDLQVLLLGLSIYWIPNFLLLLPLSCSGCQRMLEASSVGEEFLQKLVVVAMVAVETQEARLLY